uniref:adenylate kinase n=1 Tax=Salix viminalis TaxID=40686 RepID=A0A6N2M3E0_SALVM
MEKGPLNSLVLPLSPLSSSSLLTYLSLTVTSDIASLFVPIKPFCPLVVASAKANPLKIMISGAPASGKGTQCEFITEKYVLVHIAAGDLLRA